MVFETWRLGDLAMKAPFFIREIREIPVHRSLGEGGSGPIPLAVALLCCDLRVLLFKGLSAFLNSDFFQKELDKN